MAPTRKLRLPLASLLGLSTLFVCRPLKARELQENYECARAEGMGDAFTAVANDDCAMWANPAGVGRVRKARSRSKLNLTRVPNLTLGANASSSAFYTTLKGASNKDPASIIQSTQGLGDKPFWARVAAFPVALFDFGPQNPAGLGLYSNSVVNAMIQKSEPDQAQMSAISDIGAAFSYSWTDVSNRASAGVTLRSVNRYALEETIPTSLLGDGKALKARASDLRKKANASTAIGLDVGAMYTVPDFWYPTIGVAILNVPTGCHDAYLNPFSKTRENVCGTQFHGSFGNNDALSTVDPTDIRVGFAMTPRLSKDLSLRLAVDAHHLNINAGNYDYGLKGVDLPRLLHAGAELYYGNPLVQAPFSVRVGSDGGYMAFGASMNLGYLSLEFATYGTDVSDTTTPLEDRRYVTTLSVDF